MAFIGISQRPAQCFAPEGGLPGGATMGRLDRRTGVRRPDIYKLEDEWANRRKAVVDARKFAQSLLDKHTNRAATMKEIAKAFNSIFHKGKVSGRMSAHYDFVPMEGIKISDRPIRVQLVSFDGRKRIHGVVPRREFACITHQRNGGADTLQIWTQMKPHATYFYGANKLEKRLKELFELAGKMANVGVEFAGEKKEPPQ